MNKLYLVRHGESEWNTLGKIQGQEDILLTEKGRYQAKCIARKLINQDIDLIYSSDLQRAFETATIIGDTLNLEVIKLSSLREINFGIWQGLSLVELKNKYQKEHLLWMTEPHKLTIPGAESLLQLQQRMIVTVNDIIRDNKGRNILLVSHGSAIKALILAILDIDISNYNKFSLSNTGLSIIEYRDYNPVIKVLNDTCHIEEV